MIYLIYSLILEINNILVKKGRLISSKLLNALFNVRKDVYHTISDIAAATPDKDKTFLQH